MELLPDRLRPISSIRDIRLLPAPMREPASNSDIAGDMVFLVNSCFHGDMVFKRGVELSIIHGRVLRFKRKMNTNQNWIKSCAQQQSMLLEILSVLSHRREHAAPITESMLQQPAEMMPQHMNCCHIRLHASIFFKKTRKKKKKGWRRST